MKFLPFLLVLVLILSVWLLPAATFALGIVLLLVSLSIVAFLIFRRHRTAYLQGRITRAAFVRNTCLDILGVLLAVTLALLLARFIAGLLTKPIDNDQARQIAGILIGLLTGIGVGMLVNRLWRRFVKTSSQG